MLMLPVTLTPPLFFSNITDNNKCALRFPLLHEHEVAVPQPNLATVHPRLARSALER